MDLVRRFKSILEWLIFTKHCPCCDDVIGYKEEICENCRKNLKMIIGPVCTLCGLRKDFTDYSGHICEKRHYDGVASPFYASGSAKDGVYILKYGNRTDGAGFFAERMRDVVLRRFKDTEFDAVCFVPMGKIRLRERGYNQAEILSEKVAERLDILLENLLIRLKDGKVQHDLKLDERKKNVKGMFGANSTAKDKVILLVDDIKTSGYTLSECARQLKLKGAKAVYCVTAILSSKGACN